ncbi:FecR domain-containing protein [Paenibacillus xylanexedens]|uniref:FecR family protein n=1 Tax=Paenibacillus xylanexedens TaxID=528191 RepID=UPI001642E705|nr:FecR domain-containing protein [Paenibacillus xylanexedens]
MFKKIRTLTLFLALLVMITSSYSVSASTLESDGAYLTAVQGEVIVTRAGGLKSISAFANMKLYQGDRIITGDTGSVTIKVSHPESVRYIGKNSNAVISNLKQSVSGNKFSIKLWAGSMWSSISGLANADEDFVETPGSKLHVRGTNFNVTVQSDGTLSMFVASGLVAVSSTDQPSSSVPFLVAPTQQIRLNPAALPNDMKNALSVVDVAKIVGQVDPFILKAMIASSPSIIEENKQLEIQLKDSLDKKIQPVLQRDGIESDLSIKNQENLVTYLENINRLMSNIAFESVRQDKINLNDMNAFLFTTNQQISDSDRKIRLQNIAPLHPLGGLDPATAQDKEKELSRLETFQQDAEKKQLLLQSDFKAKLSLSLQQILDNKRILDFANKSILEQLQSHAEMVYTAQLSPEELTIFKKNKQLLKIDNPGSANEQVATTPNLPSSHSAPNTPQVTLEQIKTVQGFDLSIRLKDFTGSNAIYGTEFHFISENALEVISPENRFLNNSFFAPGNSVDIVKTYLGTVGNSSLTKKETIYAATQFGSASNTAISDGILATIPFSVSGDGTFRLFYVKIVDRSGKTILELNEPNAGLPTALSFTK